MVHGDVYVAQEGSLDRIIRKHLEKIGLKRLDSMSMRQIKEHHPEFYSDAKEMYGDVYDNDDEVDYDLF